MWEFERLVSSTVKIRWSAQIVVKIRWSAQIVV